MPRSPTRACSSAWRTREDRRDPVLSCPNGRTARAEVSRSITSFRNPAQYAKPALYSWLSTSSLAPSVFTSLIASLSRGSGPSALRPSPQRRSTQSVVSGSLTRFGIAADRCFPSHSPTLRPWIGGRSCTGCGSDVRRGGVLEPGALARVRRGTFLSQAGPQFGTRACSS
jgi:hypothetical protein